MTFSEIASIAGRGGLFHILKPTRSGVIVETLDDQQKKMVVSANQRVSILREVSIYTTGAEESIPLEDVLRKIHAEFDGDPGVDTSDAEELKSFLKHVIPNYDTDRVYTSDMKKLVNWYKILVAHAPEVLVEEGESTEEADVSSDTQSTTASPEEASTAPDATENNDKA